MPILNDLIDLALPSSCVCCERPGPLWCPDCRPVSTPELASTPPSCPAVYACGEYAGELRSALLCFKERGRRGLAAPLASYLSDAVDMASRARAGPGRAPLLVPVPSQRRAARERGGDHMLRLARVVARHAQLRVLPALRLTGPVADSCGLSIADRGANLGNRMSAHAPSVSVDREVLIVDDIVTTGATLAEAARALEAAGWRVSGAAVVAATRRRWAASQTLAA